MKGKTASTSELPSSIYISNVIVARTDNKSISIPISLATKGQKERTVETMALLDTGAGGVFIDQNFVRTQKLETRKLPRPLEAYNVDGTKNKKGTITDYVDLKLKIGDKTTISRFMVAGLGKQKVILGFPWFKENNPEIEWTTGHINWRKEKSPKPTIEEIPDEDRDKNQTSQPIIMENPEFPISDPQEEKGKWIKMAKTLKHDLPIFSLDLYEDDGEEVEEVWIYAKGTLATELAIQENSKKDELTTEQMVPTEYHEYLDIFSEEKANRFPDSRPWDHKIEMKEGFEPKSFKNYNLTPEEQIELDKFLKENLDKGYIRTSQSPMASPFFFVKKKDGKLRPCQDYRYLNEWTIKNAYPLPLISEIMDKLKDAKYFTKLDVRWGYNNVRIKEGDQWKAAFKTNRGLFEPTVMFFGMCNSPATFQAMMDATFADLIEKGYTIVYMDDLLIYAKTKELLEQATKLVLQRCRDNDLYLKPKKCEFCKEKVEYLGMVVQQGKISMDPTKLGGIKDWPTPTTVKQVRSFLGFGNFYRRFIRKFSELAHPLNNLLKKDVKFDWTPECQLAFDTLKRKFTKEPVLMMPDQTRPFQIECDASKYASGAVLTQTDSNGDRHPVAFISKTFSPTERNYEIYDRELLSIIRALEEWRHYIMGSGHSTIVYSDHKNLTYYRSAQNLNRRQARWSLYLSEFDIKLIHQAGTKMIQSDALSRRPDHCPDEDQDNQDITLLPENMFINLIDMDLQNRIASATDYDHDIGNILKTLLEDGPTVLKNDLSDWTTEDFNGSNILFYKGKNYVPMNLKLRQDIVKLHHDHETAGHPGELETFNSMTKHFWWPGMRTFVKNYVKGCGVCQQFKIDRSPSKPAFQPIEGAKSTRPFAHCSMDLITDLPQKDGFDSILVVVDQGLTKGVILLPCAKTITSEQTAKLLLDNLYKRFGLPDKIISDRGPQFAAHAFRELLKQLGITSALTTAYHPQSDGATERVNQEIEAYLSIYCSTHPEEWTEKLSTLEFVHNNRRHADRLKTPFELMFGESPLAIPLSFENTRYPAIEDKLKQLLNDREEALAAHELARNRMARRITSSFNPFNVGQKVWLDTRNLKTNYHKKMSPKREGPFTILEKLGPVTYRLDLPKTWKIHNVFHATLIKPYVETETHGGNFPRPPPELLEGEEVYTIESILKHRKRGRGYQYLIKWEGYPISDATWEPESAFSDDGDLLDLYKQRHQL